MALSEKKKKQLIKLNNKRKQRIRTTQTNYRKCNHNLSKTNKSI